MSLIEARRCNTAKEVIDNFKRVKANFDELQSPQTVKLQAQVSNLSQALVEVTAERDDLREELSVVRVRLGLVTGEIDAAARIPAIEEIVREVCKYFNVKRNDLLSVRRTKEVVYPRQMAMYLCKIMTLKSLPEIGKQFGGRDHTTILHAVRKLERNRQSDRDLNSTLTNLQALILAA